MPQTIETMKGDLLPIWIFQIKKKDPTTDKWVLDDLSDVTLINVYMKDTSDGTIIINGSVGAVYDLANALISYSPSGTDTDNVATHVFEARLKRTGDKWMTVPAQGYDKMYVIVNEDIRA